MVKTCLVLIATIAPSLLIFNRKFSFVIQIRICFWWENQTSLVGFYLSDFKKWGVNSEVSLSVFQFEKYITQIFTFSGMTFAFEHMDFKILNTKHTSDSAARSWKIMHDNCKIIIWSMITFVLSVLKPPSLILRKWWPTVINMWQKAEQYGAGLCLY